jgi:hypothetical protein
MNPRKMKIRRAILLALADIPDGLLLPDDLLRTEAGRLVAPRPTAAEFDEQITSADAGRLIIGVVGEEGTKWKLADPGRAWLAEHR